MTETTSFDVIIIGGSYAGLSAAMALGRSLRRVLIIDSGLPCNRQTPHSHNFLTQDGSTPQQIADIAGAQVLRYDTVSLYKGLATAGTKTDAGFKITTAAGDAFSCRKLILAAGIADKQPNIPGFAACWGISVIHCPYCHGYEVRQQRTGILANGDIAFETAKMISHWTKDLTLFTNGKATLTEKQLATLAEHNIPIVEHPVKEIRHENGYINHLQFENGDSFALKALYARLPFTQHSGIPEQLGCELTEQGYIKVDMMQRTSQKDIYACGDSTSMMRSVSNAVATGTMAGAAANRELIEEVYS